MGAMLILKRTVILVVLLLTVLQLGGAAVRAAGREVGSYEERLSERLCREIGFPRSDMEACRMLMGVFG